MPLETTMGWAREVGRPVLGGGWSFIEEDRSIPVIHIAELEVGTAMRFQ